MKNRSLSKEVYSTFCSLHPVVFNESKCTIAGGHSNELARERAFRLGIEKKERLGAKQAKGEREKTERASPQFFFGSVCSQHFSSFHFFFYFTFCPIPNQKGCSQATEEQVFHQEGNIHVYRTCTRNTSCCFILQKLKLVLALYAAYMYVFECELILHSAQNVDC